MAVGYGSPSWLVLEGVGVNLLDEATLPEISSNAWTLCAAGSAALFSELGEPEPDAYSKTGLRGPVHDLAVLDKIHIIPRSRDLGAVISLQEIEVEVWNAFLSRAKVLEDIVVSGPPGVSVIDPFGTPTHYAATRSEIYVVQVSEEGDPSIDNVVTWEFEGIDEVGTALRLVGFRLIPFPFPPDMSSPVEETFGYLTDVIVSFSGMEQRVQLRAVPIGDLSYRVFLNDRRDAQMAAAILFGNQARGFGVARWQFQTVLTSPVEVDDTEIHVTLDEIPFETGGLIMLWSSPYVWEVLTIDSIESDHLVVTSGAQRAWSIAGTVVAPTVVGRLTPDEGISWESLWMLSQTVRFSVDGWRP
jgi:hypothetical protein